jgi:micrococcal nuclease
MYEYDAVITRVYDGDTITATIDLGFKVHIASAKLRLSNIDTPEIRGVTEAEKVLGRQCRDYVKERILNKRVKIKVGKTGKYGRYLAELWYYDENDNLIQESLNQELVRLGFAKLYI